MSCRVYQNVVYILRVIVEYNYALEYVIARLYRSTEALEKIYAIHFYIIVCWNSETFIIFYVLKNATSELICRESCAHALGGVYHTQVIKHVYWYPVWLVNYFLDLRMACSL